MRLTDWDVPGVQDRLVELAATQMPLRKIALILNDQFGLTFTRNAIVGRLFRTRRELKQEEAKAADETLIPPLSPITEPTSHHPPQLKEFVEPEWPAASQGVHFHDLRDHHCRFPFGQWPNIIYCGRTRSHKSYCVKHAIVCYC